MTLQRSKKLRTGEYPLKGVVAFVEISTVDGGCVVILIIEVLKKDLSQLTLVLLIQ